MRRLSIRRPLRRFLIAAVVVAVLAGGVEFLARDIALDLLRGRIDLFSTDTLIDMLARLGVRVRLSVKSVRGRLKVA